MRCKSLGPARGVVFDLLITVFCISRAVYEFLNIILVSNPPSAMSLKTSVLQPRMSKRPPFTVEVPGSPSVNGETVPRRNARSPQQLLSQPEDGVLTLFDIVRRSASKYGDRKALGSRDLVKKHQEAKQVKKLVDGELQEVQKQWTYFELSGYNYITFREYEAAVLQIGAGFRKLGLVTPDRVHMFASTR